MSSTDPWANDFDPTSTATLEAAWAHNAIVRAHGCRSPHVVHAWGGIIFVPCKSRFAARCLNCSRVYADDYKAIARSGGPFERPDTAPECYYYFVTMTAPSFGEVHRVPKHVEEKSISRETLRCKCGEIHAATDTHLAGIPIEMHKYHWVAAARWNRDSGTLFNSWKANIRSIFPGMSYFGVREWQQRGSLHYHLIVRIPLAEIAGRSPRKIRNLIRRKIRATSATGLEGNKVQWGKQCDVQEIPTDEYQMNKRIYYLSKAVGYSLKSVSDESTLAAGVRKHLTRAAESIPCCEDCLVDTEGIRFCPHAQFKEISDFEESPGFRHKNFGASSRAVIYSRDWSYSNLTRTKQHQARKAWVAEKRAAGEWHERTVENDVPATADEYRRFVAEQWQFERSHTWLVRALDHGVRVRRPWIPRPASDDGPPGTRGRPTIAARGPVCTGGRAP